MELVRRWCTTENQFDLSRRTSCHIYLYTHAADRVTKFNVSLYFYFNFGCKSVNVICCGKNTDNKDTGIT